MRSSTGLALLRAPLLFLLLLALAAPVLAGEVRPAPVQKRGILLVAFGTSAPGADTAIDALKAQAEAAFPGVPVRLAYSSRIIRDKLAAQGVRRSSPAQALADMAAEGFTQVAVQSLQTIPGREYDDVKATAEAFQAMPKGIGKVGVGRPLLFFQKDADAAAGALLASLPKRQTGEALVLMGHGTEHPGNALYAALQLALWRRDRSVFLATVEGSPGLDGVLPEMKRQGLRKALLVPLMSVAGEHAANDMAGPEPGSLASRLAAAGVAVRADMTGLGSRPAVARLWLDHLRDAVAELER